MSLSLYSATVPTFCQILESVDGLLDKAASHCLDKGIAPQEIVGCQLTTDMFTFAYQISSTAAHSLGAINGVRKGVFSPDLTPPPADFAALKAKVGGALAGLKALDPQEVESFVGRDMRFEFRDMRIDFTAENFLLSFSLPNFFFHAATAYDLLRWKGVSVGKRDFLGRMRIKQ